MPSKTKRVAHCVIYFPSLRLVEGEINFLINILIRFRKVNCGWHIPNDFKSIEETFLDVFSRSKTDLLKKGKNGRLWMKKDFSWNEIAKKMIVSYEWLLSNKNKPDWIHL